MSKTLTLDPADRPLVHALLAALAVQDEAQPAHLIVTDLVEAGVPLPARAKSEVVPRLLAALAEADLIDSDEDETRPVYSIDAYADRFEIAYAGPASWLDRKLGTANLVDAEPSAAPRVCSCGAVEGDGKPGCSETEPRKHHWRTA